MINLLNLIDSNKCFELVRLMRWGETVTCPKCSCTHIIKQGFDETQPERQRYKCQHCQFRFDDLTGTIEARSPSAFGCMDSSSLSYGIKSLE